MKQVISILLLLGPAFAQQSGTSLLQKLGYPPDAKLLIIHADDIGMSHSVDTASFEALEKGWASSGSIMVPCPWFNEAAEFARDHPEIDLGLHLTLTSEWKSYRWGPVGRERLTTLLDQERYFPRNTSDFGAKVKPAEAAEEIAAQVAKAKSSRIRISHLDNHMGALSQSAELFADYLKLGQATGVPVATDEDELKAYGGRVIGWQHLPLPMRISPASGKELLPGYIETFSKLGPGVYIMVVHLGHDDAELRSIMQHEAGGAASRQHEYDLISHPAFRRALSNNRIRLIGWKDLARAMRPE